MNRQEGELHTSNR